MLKEQQDMLDYVTRYFKSHSHTTSGENYNFHNKLDHTYRVVKWVERICAGENVDPDIPVTTAIFHDVGYNISRAEHPAHSAVICRNYLTAHGYSEEYTNRVCSAIALHGDKSLLAPGSPMELIILLEADNIDEKGALCVLRDAMSEGNRPRSEQTYMHTFERLVRFAEKDTNNIMLTTTGNRIWCEHMRVLHEFITSLAYDLGVDYPE